MPETLAELITEAKQVQQAHRAPQLVSRLLYQAAVTNWLFVPPTGRLQSVWPGVVAWAGTHEAPAEFRERVEDQLVHFFLERLDSVEWCQIVTGQRPLQTKACQALVARYLSLPEPEAPTLKELNTALLGGWDAGALVGLADAAALWEDLDVHATLDRFSRKIRRSWQAHGMSLEWLHRAIQQWLAQQSPKRVSPLQHEAQAYRQLVEAILVPVLLCYVACWVRRLKVSESIWRQCCVPELLRDGGWLVLDYDTSIHWEHPPLEGLPELSGLLVKAWASLARHLPAIRNLALLEVDQRGRLTPLVESQPLYQRLLRWRGGVSALALLSLIDEQGGRETRDTKAAIQVLFQLFRQRKWREEDRAMWLEQSADKWVAARVKQALHSRLDVDFDFSVDVLDGLLATRFLQSILKNVLFTIQHRDLNVQHWYWLNPTDRLFASSEATVALRELVWEFPFSQWKRSGQSLWVFLSNQALSRCRKTYPEAVKRLKTQMKAARKQREAMMAQGRQPQPVNWGWFLERVTFGELRQWVSPAQLATLKTLSVTTLNRLIFKAYCLLPEADRELASLRVRWLQQEPHMTERQLHAAIRQETRRSVGAIRQAKHRVKQHANPHLRAELLKALAQ